ncbi:hypothetical protein EV182_008788, partial [Spiromyces aspiralis]
MVAEKYLDSQNAFIGLTEVVHRALKLAAFLNWNECTKRKAAATATATKTAATLSPVARKKLISESRAETI